jgi:hypothetical protein
MIKTTLSLILLVSNLAGVHTVKKDERSAIAGTYTSDMYSPPFTLVLKPNNRFKETVMGVRPDVSKGYWKISGDTLFCYATHSDKLGSRENAKLKKNPRVLRYYIDDKSRLYHHCGIGDSGPLVCYLLKK